jgi:hypothetical protein
MPKYTLRRISTNEEWDVNCSFHELAPILEDNDIVKVLSTGNFVSSIKTHANSNTSDGWKDLLGRIDKGAGRQSKIKT